jgi:hypothetical protein
LSAYFSCTVRSFVVREEDGRRQAAY